MDAATIDSLLSEMLQFDEGVSDLLFVTGKPPLVEVHGHLKPFPIDTPGGVLDQELIGEVAAHLMKGSERLQRDFASLGACDCSYSVPNIGRLRVNVFKQNGRYAVVMRKLPSQIPTLDALGLPPVFRTMLSEQNGIILITGGTGSGKTTTLAALINELNASQDIHIVTLEDPVEYQHLHQRAAICQRELGSDFPSFADGLRSAMRQAPKVILVGEIRDRESMEIAMSASETGHIVFSTLHTVSASQTLNRILGMFSREEEPQLRQRLADTMRYVVGQRLVSRLGGGRLLITEVMGHSLRTRETIVYGEAENKTFHEIIEAGSTLGWHSFDQSLLANFEGNLIDEETAMLYATSKPHMRQKIDYLLKKRKGRNEVCPSGLKMQIPEPVPEIFRGTQPQSSAPMSVPATAPPPLPATSA